MKWNPKVRATIACFGLVFIFTIFSFRLVFLQVAKHDQYTALAARKHFSSEILYAPRGVIEDINQEVLAEDVPVRKAFADGSIINDPAGLAEVFAKPLEMDRGQLAGELAELQSLATQARLARLAGRISKTPPGVCDHILNKDVSVSEEVAASLLDEMRKRSLRGIFFKPDSVRNYPNGSMLCHVLGYLNHDHAGVGGIEESLDAKLHGRNGFRYFEHDRTGKELVAYGSQEQAPRRGCDVRLTVDMGLQNIVEKELDAAYRQYKPVTAVGIIMRPKTGEILAMVNRPDFDPNELSDDKLQDRRNVAIESLVEPGSVFKIVPVGAAFNEKLFSPLSVIDCEWGHFKYGGRILHDHKPMGELTVQDVLAKSSNIGAAKIGITLGDQRLYEYIRKFGFGERTDVSLPGESAGEVSPPYRWSKLSITRLPMGQEVGVTPLQLITAMSAIANGGRLMMPQIVHEIVDEQGGVVTSFPPVEIRQVISETAAKEVRVALEGVERKGGTAVAAAVPGIIGAGKTGTAQRKGPNNGYLHDKYVLSFVGMLPADDPEFVCLVMLDSPTVKTQEENYGGQVAGPIFERIAEKAACHLNIVPHFDTPLRIALTQAKTR